MSSTWKKRLLYWAFLLLVTVIVVELCPYVVSPLLYGQAYSRSGVKNAMANVTQRDGQQLSDSAAAANSGAEANAYLGGHILHPYLGFVSVPHEQYNRFALPGPDPVTPASKDTVNVFLSGGSVALGLFNSAAETLAQRLSEAEAYKGKHIRIVLAALGGFKQPQQLMALSYFKSLGAHYDLVINLDGFNEAVLPYSDNLSFGIHPSYPRHWHIYSRKRLDSKVQYFIARQLALQQQQNELKEKWERRHYNLSNFGLMLWNVRNTALMNALAEVEGELRAAVQGSESSYQSTGPVEAVSDTAQFFTGLAERWAYASVQMRHLAEGGGGRYVHFLQPNQYVEGSKELTEEELEIAYEENDFAYKTGVLRGYGDLMAQGAVLQAQGVDFVDLTPVFREEQRTVYNDKCCHFNDLGYRLIAEAIASHIVNL